MKPIRRLRLACNLSLVAAVTVLLCTGMAVMAQCPAPVVTAGLQRPLGITQSNLGNLLVSETGLASVNTGRISIVEPSGIRRTLLNGLPSAINSIGDFSGPSGLDMRGRTLYALIGEGDATLPGPFPGAEFPNPNPSSPLFSSVLAIHISAHAEAITEGFTLTAAHQQALAGGQKVILSHGNGDRITVELVVNFPNFLPNPILPPGFVVHSNPFDLVVVGNELFATDGGLNLVWRSDISTGAFSVLTPFGPIANPLPPPPPVVEAVPTGIAYADGQLLVTLFRGFPFPLGESDVVQVDPKTGNSVPFIDGLTAAIDMLPITGKGDTDHLVLQFASGPFLSGLGHLVRFETPSGPSTVVAGCLITPTSMVLDQKSNTLYITELATGRVVTVPVTQ